MNIAFIKDGKVKVLYKNVGVNNPLPDIDNDPVLSTCTAVECDDTVGGGDLYDGSTFSTPVIPISEAEVRSDRNGRLVLSDYILLPDIWANLSSSKQNEWTVYRQALRDVTGQDDFPETVTWPTKPS